MGIILSLIFPRLYMTTDNPASSARSSSSRSSTPSTHHPRSPTANASPSPFSDTPSSPMLATSYLEQPQQQPQQPQDRASYMPHAVGLGIISPQPIVGPFPSFGRSSSSPTQERSSSTSLRQGTPPSEPGKSDGPSDYFLCDLQSTEDIQLLPRSPGIAGVLPQTAEGSANLLGSTSSSSGAGNRGAGLQIAIQSPALSNSTSTPSPPLLPVPTASPLPSRAGPSTVSIIRDYAWPQEPASFITVDDAAFPMGADAISADANLDFTEFDSEGLNALEKIYLFSRSRASFHRVFILHALPRYLGADDAENGYPSRELVDQMSSEDAVEYVLPLLNGLALDEDEAVQEALACQLVNIIWWFITHCQVVEDERISQLVEALDTTPQPDEHHQTSDEADATQLSVQAFTPILGTLLLSQNALVGTPARNAVVELLKRIWHADEREAGRPAHPLADDEMQRPDYDMGFLQRPERRLFEHELVYQVVIGMGRLDLPDTDEGPLSTMSTPRSIGEYNHSISESQSLEYPMQTPPGPDTSTAGSTPLAVPTGNAHDSYFPAFSSIHPTPAPATSPSGHLASVADERRTVEVATPPTFQLNFPPPSPRREAGVNTPTPGGSSPLRTTPPAPLPHPVAAQSAPAMSTEATMSLSTVLSPPLSAPAATTADVTSSISSYSTELESSTPSLVSTSMSSSILTDSSTSLITPSNSNSTWATTETFIGVTGEAELALAGPNVRPQTDAHKDVVMASAAVESPSRNQADVGCEPMDSDDYFSQISPESDDVINSDVSPQDMEVYIEEGRDIGEEAAMGRLSSMSLMAAVTASGGLTEETKNAFVTEVERVGRDPVYWVRREAAFAVGALAKVVPDEVVTSSLLPLFETLYQDPTWHVRHSVLFALPAILSRLPAHRRRSLALSVILPLASDNSPTVRSAVLESLGEVLDAFHGDPYGPPQELLNIFLGVRDGHVRPIQLQDEQPQSAAPPSAGPSSESSFSSNISSKDGFNTHDIYEDPARPLVCAFNTPAVALTLGSSRWPELRPLYRSLARNPSFKVRRTLAASIGEIAKIIGSEHAKEDLMDVWWSSLDADESEVRLKAIECAATFVGALERPLRREVMRRLAEAFTTQRLKGWREREEVVKNLPSLLTISDLEEEVLRDLFMRALGDRVSAIREAAISVFPAFVRAWQAVPQWVNQLRSEIRALARSDAYRERTTFVTCEQSLLDSGHRDFIILDDEYFEILSLLAQDTIVDVRIRAARLLGTISDIYGNGPQSTVMSQVLKLTTPLLQDNSQDVRAFAAAVHARGVRPRSLAPAHSTHSVATFSRPPPPTPS